MESFEPPFEVIPAGEYHVQIVDSSVCSIESDDNRTLLLELVVIDGAYINKRLFDWLSLENENEAAADIGLRTLATVCRATGQLSVTDSEQLHHKSMIANVKMQHTAETIQLMNTVAYYLPYTTVAAE
jgi:hypothetical protein